MSSNGAGNGSISLASLRTVDEAKMVVRYPMTNTRGERDPIRDSKGQMLVLTLASSLHKAKLQADANMRKAAQHEQVTMGEISAEREFELNLNWMADRIIGWGPAAITLDDDGPPLSPSSTADKLRLLTEFTWLYEDLQLFFVQKSAFLASQQPGSSPTPSIASTPSDPPLQEGELSPTTGGSEPGAKGRRGRATAPS